MKRKLILLVMALVMTIGSFSQTLTAKGKGVLELVPGEEKSSVIVYKMICDDYLSFASIFGVIAADLEEITIAQSEIDYFFKQNLAWFDEKYKFKSNAPFLFLIPTDNGYAIKSIFWDRDEKRATATSMFKLEEYQFSSDNYQPLVVVPAKKRPPR